MLDRILDAATDNLRFAKILVQMGLDPNNVTWDAIFNRLLEIFLHNITLANMFALVGAIFFVATLLTHTMVPLRVANMIGCAFFAIFGALTGAVTTLFLYLLMIPINAYRLRQMLALVKKARTATQGDMSMEHGPNAKSGVALKWSAYWGKPEVAGLRSKRRFICQHFLRTLEPWAVYHSAAQSHDLASDIT